MNTLSQQDYLEAFCFLFTVVLVTLVTGQLFVLALEIPTGFAGYEHNLAYVYLSGLGGLILLFHIDNESDYRPVGILLDLLIQSMTIRTLLLFMVIAHLSSFFVY